MFTLVVVLLAILALAVGGIYILLKKMGEEGIEVAAPGSCKRGRCGVRPVPPASDEPLFGDAREKDPA